MTFRKWKYEDVLKIAELEVACFSDPWNYRMFAESFSSNFSYGVVAEEGGEVVAYALETILFETAEIQNVAVAEAHRRKGIAEKLMELLEKEAFDRGAENSLLEVRVSNAPAMRMYLKRGYVGVFARKKYYPDGEDALIMKKVLR